MRISWASSSTLSGPQVCPHLFLSPHHPKSATACAILFSHISSASADFQLTRDPAPTPCTSFICLSKRVTHSSLPSPSQYLWLYSFKDSELTDALVSTVLTSLPIGMFWIKWEWFNFSLVYICVSLNKLHVHTSVTTKLTRLQTQLATQCKLQTQIVIHPHIQRVLILNA